jgi:hypothetical protein
MKASYAVVGGLVLMAVPAIAQPHQHQHDHPAGATENVGRVRFQTSCDAHVQPTFEKAVAMLHSFWFEEAAATFKQVAERDPQCARAYWGLAASKYQPLWEPPPPAAIQDATAALDRARTASKASPRERAWVDAIAHFYRDVATVDHRTRAIAYADAMERLHAAYPDDDEAAAFYAIALQGTALKTDKTYAAYKKSAAVLDRIAARHPSHPGVAHYYIHAYDTPELANLALNAARSYAKIAPDVPHALHMPSHIFTRLGLWQDSIVSNLASAKSARAFAVRVGMKGNWDQELHALDYLMYAYLQGAQDREAEKVLNQLRAVKQTNPAVSAAYALAAAPARFMLERRQWAAAAALSRPPIALPWEKYRWSESNVYFAAALGAARTGQSDRARQQIALLQQYQHELTGKDVAGAALIDAQRRMASAWLARAEGNNDEATKLAREAADIEDGIDKHPVTPGAVLPARELFADLLLEVGQPAAALPEYERSLQNAPKRLLSLAGAARAAKLSGDGVKARQYYKQLVELTAQADTPRPEITEAKEFLSKNKT